ncbi:MAG: flagellar basal-body MS-ring/collar protein FliF, partial [Pseudomonadales bacterium]
MAELPVQADALDPNPGPTITPVAVPGTDFLRGALSMPATRQFMLMAALAGSVALGVAAVLWMKTPDFRALTSLNDPYQAQEIGQALDAMAIEYRIDPNSGVLLVASADYHRARMQLAGADALGRQQLGYELLDREQGFGVSQAMESVQRRRSLEGELARSIATISSVRSARVLLAEPQRTAFIRDRRKATASVSVNVNPGRRLDRDQIRGIVNLVAGAVPELAAPDVAVVDQSGQLLSEDETDASLQQSVFQLEYVARVEDSMRRKVSNILAPSLGLTGFSAEVSVDVDFTRTEQTEELFNPDLTAVRSEAAVTEESSGANDAARGIPGALANDPVNTEANPAAGGAEEVRRSRNEVTKNYEVDRTISHTRHASAMLSRVSVSVVVDDKPQVAAPQTADA